MEPIRLQKYFTDCGVLSRRAAEHEIEEGNVTVNGKRAQLGDKITPHRDAVVWNGQKILPPARNQEHVYLMLNKPRGYLCRLGSSQPSLRLALLLFSPH